MAVPRESLERFPVFWDIGSAEAEVAAACSEQLLSEGTVLHQAGTSADTVYFMLDGRVDDVAEGVVVAAHVAGDVFGQSGLFVPPADPYHWEVIEPSRCLTIPVETLRALLGRHSKLALNFLRLYAWRLQVAIRFGLSLGAQAADAAVPRDAEPIALLHSLSLFNGIDDDQFFQHLASNLKHLEFIDGDRLESRGDKDGQLHILVEGEASVRTDAGELGRLKPGEGVGILALLSGEPAESDVVAIGRCSTLSLARNHLYTALLKSAPLCRNFLRALVLQTEAALRAATASASADLKAGSSRPVAVYLDAPWDEFPPTSWRPPKKVPRAKPVPLTAALAVTISESAPTPTEHGDDFKKALQVQRDELVRAFSAPTDSVTKLVDDLYSALRSPIHPKSGVSAIAAALATTTPPSVRLRCVLASPTAVDELPHYLAFARIFRRHGVHADLSFLLVRWENLVDARQGPAGVRDKLWAAQTEGVRAMVGTEGQVVPVDVRLDEQKGAVLNPADFRRAYEKVSIADAANLTTVRKLPVNALRLTRDLAWIKPFYNRQNSLSRLGEAQPVLDLALRRAIGRRFCEEDRAAATPPMFMVTSELHSRMLSCYDATLPTLNIKVAGRIDTVPIQVRTIDAQGTIRASDSGWDSLQLKSGEILRFLETVFPDLSSWFDFAALGHVPEKAIAVVVEEQNKVIGFAYARQDSLVNGREGKDKWILNIVAVATSGGGVGTKIMMAVKQLALINGARCIFANTDPARLQTIKFYKKHGFTEDGSVGHYYYNGSAVWLWSDLR